MIDKPIIPMRPQDRPYQPGRYPLPLPPRPEGFQGYCEWVGGMQLPEHLRPKGSPRKVTYLGMVEWAFDPMHCFVEAYYLGRRGRYWLLWIRSEDDNQIPWKWVWALGGHAVGKDGDPWTAAVYLLMDVWKARQSIGSHKYHWIDEVGHLSVEEFEAIAAVVWPEAGPVEIRNGPDPDDEGR